MVLYWTIICIVSLYLIYCVYFEAQSLRFFHLLFFAKNNNYVLCCMESDCTLPVDMDMDIDIDTDKELGTEKEWILDHFAIPLPPILSPMKPISMSRKATHVVASRYSSNNWLLQCLSSFFCAEEIVSFVRSYIPQKSTKMFLIFCYLGSPVNADSWQRSGKSLRAVLPDKAGEVLVFHCITIQNNIPETVTMQIKYHQSCKHDHEGGGGRG